MALKTSDALKDKDYDLTPYEAEVIRLLAAIEVNTRKV